MSTPYLPLDMAVQAAQVALSACAADGYDVSVAIVARDGATKVHLKADNSGPHTVDSAQGKTFTSASMSRDTAGLANFIGEPPSMMACAPLQRLAPISTRSKVRPMTS